MADGDSGGGVMAEGIVTGDKGRGDDKGIMTGGIVRGVVAGGNGRG